MYPQLHELKSPQMSGLKFFSLDELGIWLYIETSEGFGSYNSFRVKDSFSSARVTEID